MTPFPRRGQQGMPVYVAGPPMAQDILKLASNENAWGCSPKAAAAYQQACGDLHRYPDSKYQVLRQALAERVQSPLDQIAVGAGSEQLITLLMSAYAGPGDEVLVSQYGFALLRIAARMGNAEVVLAPEAGLHTDVDALLAAVTERTRVVAIATPNNPTGTALSGAELRRLRSGMPDGVLLLLDLAYGEFGPQYALQTAHSMARERQDTVVLRTFSKAHGLAAARVGWAHASAELLAPVGRLRPPFPISQAGAAAALASLADRAWLSSSMGQLATQRETLREGLRALALPALPSHTNFLYVDFGSADAARRAGAFCAENGVLLRGLRMYGLDKALRATVGTGPESRRLLDLLTTWSQKQ